MNMLFILKGQDLTPIFRAHACARSALRARQSRWRPQRSSPRAALGAVISISAAPVARMRRGGPRAAGSRFLKAPVQAAAAPARRWARNHAQPARMPPPLTACPLGLFYY